MNPEPHHTWLTATLREEQPAWPDHQNTSFEEHVWQTGLEHGVLPLCFQKISAAASWETIPASFCERLRTLTLNAAAIELIQSQELIKALTVLHTRKTSLILIKGAPLSYSIYPKPYLRPRCDTDLLFPDKTTTQKAWELLQKGGYEQPNATHGDIISHEFSCFKTGPNHIQHNLDLHWKLSNNQLFAHLFDFNELLESAITIPELNNAHALCPEHALLLACVHRITHKPDKNENRLIWLYDIHLLCHSLNPEKWQNFISIAIKKELCGICLEGLQQAKLSFKTSISETILLKLADQGKHERITAEVGTSRSRLELTTFKALPSLRQRLQYLKEHLFPNQEYIMRKYNTRNRLWLPYLYVKRIAQGLPKLFN